MKRKVKKEFYWGIFVAFFVTLMIFLAEALAWSIIGILKTYTSEIELDMQIHTSFIKFIFILVLFITYTTVLKPEE